MTHNIILYVASIQKNGAVYIMMCFWPDYGFNA